jgi:hypothetical protein
MKFFPALFLLFISGSRAAAQKQPVEPDACVSKIPASEFKRVPVFLEATADAQSRGILPSADFFAQSVAFKLRELTGGSESQLAEADSLINWRIWGEVLVTVHRDGPLSLRVPEWSVGADALRGSSLKLLKRAVESVIASGESIALPPGSWSDSVTFGLSLVNPRVTKERKIIPVKARQAIPVFTIPVAWEKSVELTRNPNIVYPEFSRLLRSIGMVRLAFAVDKDGRVDPASIRELWPVGVERPTGDLGKSYEAFRRNVIRDLPTARFSPAVIGGCVVKQIVHQEFEFKLDRR